jgi:hypothetical protein
MKKLCLCLALASLLGLGGQAFAVIGTIDNVPAATLLLPYFEVATGGPSTGVNTLFSINNASATAALAHVTVWSDQSIPVLDFDVYLTGYDIQTINLFDVLINGNLPRTASAGQDPNNTISPKGPISQDINFASCSGILPYTNPALNAAFRAHLLAVLQGNPSPTFGTCYGSKQNDGILRGYVTVDAVNSCNVLFPSQLATGYAADLTSQNILWGDYFYVNSAQNFAQGDALVHIEACPTCTFNHTFYGRYDGGAGTDFREALPTTMAARYLSGGDFTGGTTFLVWREGGDQTSAVSYACTRQGPAQWYPLPSTQIGVFDETEQVVTPENCPSGFDCGITINIPNEAQRVRVSATDGILTPFAFGWAYLNLQWGPLPAYGDNFAQMWLTTEMDANGRFSVGFAGVQLDNANTPTTTLIPFP